MAFLNVMFIEHSNTAIAIRPIVYVVKNIGP